MERHADLPFGWARGSHEQPRRAGGQAVRHLPEELPFLQDPERGRRDGGHLHRRPDREAQQAQRREIPRLRPRADRLGGCIRAHAMVGFAACRSEGLLSFREAS